VSASKLVQRPGTPPNAPAFPQIEAYLATATPALVNLRIHPQLANKGTASCTSTSLYVNVAALIRDGASAPEPDIMPLTEDSYLFYSGEFNLIFGDSESGKTWLALAAVADVLTEQGGKAAFIDLDHNGAPSIISRLQDFGVSDDILSDQQRFRLTQDDGIELREVVQDLAVFAPDIAVLDSLGEALGLYKYDSNDGGDFTTAHTRIIKPLTRVGTGVTVIDHLAKNAGSREFGPTGTPATTRSGRNSAAGNSRGTI
jgi:AAA domain